MAFECDNHPFLVEPNRAPETPTDNGCRVNFHGTEVSTQVPFRRIAINN